MNPALIYCMAEPTCWNSTITVHDWVVSGLAFLGILAVMGLLFWLAGRFL